MPSFSRREEGEEHSQGFPRTIFSGLLFAAHVSDLFPSFFFFCSLVHHPPHISFHRLFHKAEREAMEGCLRSGSIPRNSPSNVNILSAPAKQKKQKIAGLEITPLRKHIHRTMP